MDNHRLFRSIWWATNSLLAFAIVATLATGLWELSVRYYLQGYSDAIVPEASTPRQKVEAILKWFRVGPPRLEAPDMSVLSPHDPTNTLNYRQLLAVCGSATNAFLNLARSSGLEARRLLLLNPDRTAKHVVAEVKIDNRWVIVDAAYRVIMKDSKGNLLTRRDLQDPAVFQDAIGQIPGYIPYYNYEMYAHIRTGFLPLHGAKVRHIVDSIVPGWDEYLDWSLLLERRSFAYFFLCTCALIFLLPLRVGLAWFADHRLRVARFQLRTSLSRATATFFSTPEIK